MSTPKIHHPHPESKPLRTRRATTTPFASVDDATGLTASTPESSTSAEAHHAT